MMICKFVRYNHIYNKNSSEGTLPRSKNKKKMNFLLIYNHRDGIHGNLLLLIFIHI